MEIIFDYFLKNFCLYYELDTALIDYGVHKGGVVSIPRGQRTDIFERKQDIDTGTVIWKEWKGVSIPFLFDTEDKAELFEQEEDHVQLNYDIVASAFYFLSGWSEFISSEKDQFGRVNYKSSVIKQLDLIKIPVVNYYFDLLYTVLKSRTEVSKKRLWGNHDFGVAITHDIDACESAWLEGGYSQFKKGKVFSIPQLLLRKLSGKDDWFNFSLMSEITLEYADSSTFYFLARKGKAGKLKNADYDVTSPKVQKAISELKAAGHEIGVHGSFGSHRDSQLLKEDMKRISNGPLTGNRFHFLMYDNETVRVLRESGVKYDTSLGFAEHIGFRRGTCYPFYLYDHTSGTISDIIELPLTVMDVTLIFGRYMGIEQDKVLDEIAPLIDEILKFNGVFTLLWHNTAFSEFKYEGWKDVYVSILKYCREKNALLTGADAIYGRINS